MFFLILDMNIDLRVGICHNVMPLLRELEMFPNGFYKHGAPMELGKRSNRNGRKTRKTAVPKGRRLTDSQIPFLSITPLPKNKAPARAAGGG